MCNSLPFQRKFGFFTKSQLKLIIPNVFTFYNCTYYNIFPLLFNQAYTICLCNRNRNCYTETYWIPNSFLSASNHSKFSFAATANVQVNYEQQIFDKEKSSDLRWQASILAKVSSCKTSRYEEALNPKTRKSLPRENKKLLQFNSALCKVTKYKTNKTKSIQ